MEISNDGKYWKNLEFTSSPTKNGKYIPLDDNPSGNSKKGFLRKYLRNDPVRTRGDLLPKYKLSDRDKKKVNNYLKNKKS